MIRAVPRASYHHGSLRDTLVDASVALIRAEGIGAVSLRRVAREAGVSPGAPYHHFADRAELLAAIAAQGSRLLEHRLEAARDGASTPGDAIAAMVETYVLFARDEPAYFRLACRPELATPDHEGAQCTFRLLHEAIEAGQRAGSVPAGPPGPLIGMVWALAHGLAALWLDGPLEKLGAGLASSPAELTQRIAAGLRAILSGAARAGVELPD